LALEIDDTQLMSKSERRKQFVGSMEAIREKRRREWLIKHGKKHRLNFLDE